MIEYFVIKNFRGTCSPFAMLKGYIITCWNVEAVHGQKKVGNPCTKQTTIHGCHMHEIWMEGKGHTHSMCLWEDKVWIIALYANCGVKLQTGKLNERLLRHR